MEGSLEAPTRHVIPWQDEAWYDEAALDAELRRVYDICHGCRRCFNLCDSFPILFEAIDEAPNEEVEDLTKPQLQAVVDACTLLFEIADPQRRDAFLRTIGGVEGHISIQVGGQVIKTRPEGDVERTRESDGKASAVHFLHFDFNDAALAAWKSGEGNAMLVIDHPSYGHAAIINADNREYLGRECFG